MGLLLGLEFEIGGLYANKKKNWKKLRILGKNIEPQTTRKESKEGAARSGRVRRRLGFLPGDVGGDRKVLEKCE